MRNILMILGVIAMIATTSCRKKYDCYWNIDTSLISAGDTVNNYHDRDMWADGVDGWKVQKEWWETENTYSNYEERWRTMEQICHGICYSKDYCTEAQLRAHD